MTVNTNHVKPDLEPRFVLRAQDELAISTLSGYRALCIDLGMEHQAAQVLLAIQDFLSWQRAHPDRVKRPDHDHVPVRHSV